MKQLRAVIIDDEPAAIQVITELVAQLTEDVIIEDVAANGVEGIKKILAIKPDLVFLDIDMPLKNGLQMLDMLGTPEFELIFTTGSAAYAMQAVKLRAVDYLLKPIDPADMLIAIDKVRKVMELKMKRLPSDHSSRKLSFHTLQGVIYLEESEIIMVTGMGSYCMINTVSSEKITISKAIGQVEEILSADRFFRCHNSRIVNLDYITRFSSKGGYSVILKDGSSVEVSRRSKDKLLAVLSERYK
jgi:two-component system LytT family response regulator